MTEKPEQTKAVVQNLQRRKKQVALIANIERAVSDAEQKIAQLRAHCEKDADQTMDLLQQNGDLKIRVTALQKELLEQTAKAHRLEQELREQVMKNQHLMQQARGTAFRPRYDMAAEEDFDEQELDSKERMIALSTIISFGSSLMTPEGMETVVHLLDFAVHDRTPEEDKAIKKMIADFRGLLRPQMAVKDSTQNFYL